METDVLKEILSLAKESASADAALTADVSSITKRMEKQEQILDQLVQQVGEQKRIMERVEEVKQTVITNELRIKKIEDCNLPFRVSNMEHFQKNAIKRIADLENRPAKTLASALTKVTWGVVMAVVSAVGALIINIFK